MQIPDGRIVPVVYLKLFFTVYYLDAVTKDLSSRSFWTVSHAEPNTFWDAVEHQVIGEIRDLPVRSGGLFGYCMLGNKRYAFSGHLRFVEGDPVMRLWTGPLEKHGASLLDSLADEREDNAIIEQTLQDAATAEKSNLDIGIPIAQRQRMEKAQEDIRNWTGEHVTLSDIAAAALDMALDDLDREGKESEIVQKVRMKRNP